MNRRADVAAAVDQMVGQPVDDRTRLLLRYIATLENLANNVEALEASGLIAVPMTPVQGAAVLHTFDALRMCKGGRDG